MIYAYTTPEIHKHDGWTKIGYTGSQTPKQRIKQQTHTADIAFDLKWQRLAAFPKNLSKTFTDHDFHKFLTDKMGVERKPNTEWFHIDSDTAQHYFDDFINQDYSKVEHGAGKKYVLRREQADAVAMTKAYFKKHGKGTKFLWNAKPRFGKTLATYDLIKQMNLANVLIVTNRPAVANSWYQDFHDYIAESTDYKFVSENDALKGKGVLTRNEFVKQSTRYNNDWREIAFESLQGLKGSVFFGGNNIKLKWIRDLHWDLLVIDEAHEGVDTYKTDKAFSYIKRDYTLSLTGTPFKALAKGEFEQDQIFNWSYAQEQHMKNSWNEDEQGASPYANLPRLNMYTYQMSNMMLEKANEKVDLTDDEQVDPAFDLNEFFRSGNGHFVHDKDVDHFLDTLTTGNKYPFSTDKFRKQMKHTFWLLYQVDSAKLLAKKLQNHPVFSKYAIILAAGDGKLDDEKDVKSTEKAYNRVMDTINKVDNGQTDYIGTITLSVGQLTTGVTIPQWSGVLMLSNMKSPAEYMQAAFRAQNPYKYSIGTQIYQKQDAYVFDFDPSRTLSIFDEFANNLNSQSVHDIDLKDRKRNIKRLLNFFPVLGEDDQGQMVELDAEQITTIPARLKSTEVVRHGFMSNFLFDNISNIFSAPKVVTDILNNLHKAKEDRTKVDNTIDDAENLHVDDDGEVNIPDDIVIGKTQDVFGDKVYAESQVNNLVQNTQDIIDNAKTENDAQKVVKQVAQIMKKSDDENVWSNIKDNTQLTKRELKHYQDQNDKENADELFKIADRYNDQQKIAQAEFEEKQKQAHDDAEKERIQAEYEKQKQSLHNDFNQKIKDHVEQKTKELPTKAIKQIATDQEQKKKDEVEDDVRSHLRGFSRTIPSFLMAYGNHNTTLENFENGISDDVFKEVTGISIDEFKFLRDGGDYQTEDGQTKHFAGHLFNSTVFNESVQAFLDKKEKLSNYFNPDLKEDIFDYIPAQRTNQIFTPKKVVVMMVDDLEKECPNIFDDPDTTFADLYVKSGLYIAEIVKRLYQNQVMKAKYPNDDERLLHILNHQVYMLAPTEIIYRIATNFVLGFKPELRKQVNMKHFKCADSAEAAKDGKLQELVDEAFND